MSLKSDDEADGRPNGQHNEVDKEQDAGNGDLNARGVLTRTRRSTSTKSAQNKHRVNGGKKNNAEHGCSRNSKSPLTVVQGSDQLSDEDSAVCRKKQQKTSKK